MSDLGVTSFNDLIGRSDLLCKQSVIDHWKAKDIDLSNILWKPETHSQKENFNSSNQKHDIHNILDLKVIADVEGVLDGSKRSIQISKNISNTDRSFGAMLSGKIAKKFGHKGLSEDSIVINLKGTAGQSFGTFLAKGVTLILSGEGNDYVGKGLSGGRIIIKQFEGSKIKSNENIIVGNTVLYGAISGECYLSGIAGERFAVRNSGAISVVEGTGDHCCEYMTGGIVMVLGETGVNFGAGMSGGIAYIYDRNKNFQNKCNLSMVEIQNLSSDNEMKENIFNKYSFLDSDYIRVREMLTRHSNYTNSAVARFILDNFEEEVKNFIKVIPIDFKRAIETKKLEQIKEEKNNMGKVTGFLEFDRVENKSISPKTRVKNYNEFVLPFSEKTLNEQASRCMNCGIPYCHNSCPINNIIPDWNGLVYEGDWKNALKVLHSTNNFPEFTSRICPAPCEAACTLNIEDNPVTIKSIERSIIDRAFKEGWIIPEVNTNKTDKKIAVVGSGPAGLACAQQLARAGHNVTVYEKNDRVGGLLRYGIPNFKMEKHFIDKRVEQMTKEGVTFKCNSHIGKNIDVKKF